MKPKIQVFVTKTWQFRARVNPDDGQPPFEVTVGGKSWTEENKGGPWKKQILAKCKELAKHLENKLNGWQNQRHDNEQYQDRHSCR